MLRMALGVEVQHGVWMVGRGCSWNTAQASVRLAWALGVHQTRGLFLLLGGGTRWGALTPRGVFGGDESTGLRVPCNRACCVVLFRHPLLPPRRADHPSRPRAPWPYPCIAQSYRLAVAVGSVFLRLDNPYIDQFVLIPAAGSSSLYQNRLRVLPIGLTAYSI